MHSYCVRFEIYGLAFFPVSMTPRSFEISAAMLPFERLSRFFAFYIVGDPGAMERSIFFLMERARREYNKFFNPEIANFVDA